MLRSQSKCHSVSTGNSECCGFRTGPKPWGGGGVFFFFFFFLHLSPHAEKEHKFDHEPALKPSA
jgi:hypothetical protein